MSRSTSSAAGAPPPHSSRHAGATTAHAPGPGDGPSANERSPTAENSRDWSNPDSWSGRTVILLPTYEEAGTIERMVVGLQAAVPDATVLIIDDASADGTAALARKAALDPERLVVMERPAKTGLGSAYRDGFRWALEHGAAVVATLDADLSHDPADLPNLLSAIRDGADLAIGSRFVAGGSAAGLSPARRLLSRGVNLVSSTALETRIRDGTSGFRAYRLRPGVADAMLNSASTGFTIQLELLRALLEQGGRVTEVPIRFEPRAAGHSKLSAAISTEAARKLAGWHLQRLRTPKVRLPVAAAGLATALALLVLALPWRGADYPAQLHRIAFFRQAGFALWDNQWYAGHATLSYSVVFPPIAAVLGAGLTAVASCAVASWCFARVVTRRWGANAGAGALLFASGTAVNVLVGRLTFALGLAVGLMAITALQARRTVLAGVLSPVCALASPVAGAFLALGGAAWAISLGRRARYGRWRSAVSALRSPGGLLFAGGVVPLAGLALLFPDHGSFPLLAGNAAAGIVACALVAWLSSDRILRAGAALYAVALVATFAVANPLGGNATRLAAFAAAPLLACLLRQGVAVGWRWRWQLLGQRTVLASVVALLVAWQWLPAATAIAEASNDPSTDKAYYQPVLDFFAAHPANRIEIPFTQNHWETVYVASTVPLARGWQRDLDIAYNPLFYKPSLAAGDYRDWLVQNAVQYVALPDAPLDPSARQEEVVLQAGVDGLRVVYQDSHWRIWAVDGTRPLVDGPAALTRMGAGSFDLRVDQPGTIVVRIRASAHWTAKGPATVSGSSDGWIELHASAPGVLKVHQTLSIWPKSSPGPGDGDPADSG